MQELEQLQVLLDTCPERNIFLLVAVLGGATGPMAGIGATAGLVAEIGIPDLPWRDISSLQLTKVAAIG